MKKSGQRCHPSRKSTHDQLKLLEEEQREEVLVENLLGLNLNTLETPREENCEDCWGLTCSHDFGGWD